MTLKPDSILRSPFSYVCAGVVLIWSASAAWGTKADRAEVAVKADKVLVDNLQKDMNDLKQMRAVDTTIQSNILELLKKMDTRMERLEDKQDIYFREILKGRELLPPTK